MKIAFVILLFFSLLALASNNPQSYSEAKKIWSQTKLKPEYQKYGIEFTQFNNYFHLDEKDECYQLGSGPVNLMLVITHTDQDEFAIIEQVFSDIDNAKSQCFKNSYRGVRTKIPPYLPFVLQLGMG